MMSFSGHTSLWHTPDLIIYLAQYSSWPRFTSLHYPDVLLEMWKWNIPKRRFVSVIFMDKWITTNTRLPHLTNFHVFISVYASYRGLIPSHNALYWPNKIQLWNKKFILCTPSELNPFMVDNCLRKCILCKMCKTVFFFFPGHMFGWMLW